MSAAEISPLARRVGPPVVGAVLLVTAVVVAQLGWLSVPTYPTVWESGTRVPAVLLLPAGQDGCMALLDGVGDELARDCDERFGYASARPVGGTVVLVEDVGGALAPGEGRELLPDPDPPRFATYRWDLADGSLVETDEDVQVEQEPGRASYELVDGPRVVVDGRVLAELDGPRTGWPEQAIVDRDGRWAVVQDGYGRVLAVPPGGEPLLWWAGEDEDRWLWLPQSVAWDGR